MLSLSRGCGCFTPALRHRPIITAAVTFITTDSTSSSGSGSTSSSGSGGILHRK